MSTTPWAQWEVLASKSSSPPNVSQLSPHLAGDFCSVQLLLDFIPRGGGTEPELSILFFCFF